MIIRSFYLKCDPYVNSLAFHVKRDSLLASTVAGDLRIYNIVEPSQGLELIWSNHTTHSRSIRKADFSTNGRGIISVSADKRVCITDVERNHLKWYGKGHKDGISTFCIIDTNTIATGSDDGEIRIWDTRSENPKCRSKALEFDSSISAISVGKNTTELLATCDDQIGCFDLRNGKVSLQAMSDNAEDEFQCLALIKDKKKVVCGTNTGNLCLFSYGQWGDLNDRLNLHQQSIDSIIPYDDDNILVGGDDGKVHVVSCFPNKPRGELTRRSNLGLDISHIDSLCLSPLGTYLGFISNFEHICLIPESQISDVIRCSEDEQGFFGDL